jgi:hypothetical protein
MDDASIELIRSCGRHARVYSAADTARSPTRDNLIPSPSANAHSGRAANRADSAAATGELRRRGSLLAGTGFGTKVASLASFKCPRSARSQTVPDGLARFSGSEVAERVVRVGFVIHRHIHDPVSKTFRKMTLQSDEIPLGRNVRPSGEANRPASHEIRRGRRKAIENQIRDSQGGANCNKRANRPLGVGAKGFVRDYGPQRMRHDHARVLPDLGSHPALGFGAKLRLVEVTVNLIDEPKDRGLLSQARDEAFARESEKCAPDQVRDIKHGLGIRRYNGWVHPSCLAPQFDKQRAFVIGELFRSQPRHAGRHRSGPAKEVAEESEIDLRNSIVFRQAEAIKQGRPPILQEGFFAPELLCDSVNGEDACHAFIVARRWPDRERNPRRSGCRKASVRRRVNRH